MKIRKADLHVHTTYSDGTFTPKEAVEYAKSKGLNCIAISDHDSVAGLKEALETAGLLGIEVIPAVEISAEEDGKELHILGYFIDFASKTLLDTLAQIRENRKQRLYKMVDALKRHGVDIDADDVIKFAKDVSISRLHVAQYMEAKGLVPSWRDAFKKYIGDDRPCYVASFRFTARQAIDLIKNSGGIPVIAHPGLNNVDGLLTKLVGYGIRGVEAFHTDHTKSVSMHYEDYARSNNLLVTGGSDCHGRAKGKILMGTVTIPYKYVEALKDLYSERSNH